jgi:hypothetical protein
VQLKVKKTTTTTTTTKKKKHTPVSIWPDGDGLHLDFEAVQGRVRSLLQMGSVFQMWMASGKKVVW